MKGWVSEVEWFGILLRCMCGFDCCVFGLCLVALLMFNGVLVLALIGIPITEVEVW